MENITQTIVRYSWYKSLRIYTFWKTNENGKKKILIKIIILKNIILLSSDFLSNIGEYVINNYKNCFKCKNSAIIIWVH